MITYKEALGMIKRAATSGYDLTNPSVVRALRARQRMLKQRGQNTAELDSILSKAPASPPLHQVVASKQWADSHPGYANDPPSLRNTVPGFNDWVNAQEYFNRARYRDNLRHFYLDQAHNAMNAAGSGIQYSSEDASTRRNDIEKAYAAENSRLARIQSAYARRDFDTFRRELGGGIMPSAPKLPGQERLKRNLDRQLYRQSFNSSNPEIARSATQTAMMEQDPELANRGYDKAKELGAAPNSWQMREGINPQVAQRIIDSQLARPQEQPTVTQNEQVRHPYSGGTSQLPAATPKTTQSSVPVGQPQQKKPFQGGNQQAFRKYLGITPSSPNKGRITYIDANGQQRTIEKVYNTPATPAKPAAPVMVGKYRMKQVAPGVWLPENKSTPTQQQLTNTQKGSVNPTAHSSYMNNLQRYSQQLQQQRNRGRVVYNRRNLSRPVRGVAV